MLTVLAFLLAIGVLVTIHEFGHYLAARSCGVRVLRFSIGFGRPIYRYQRADNTTEWVVSWLPLGGYVKMLDSRAYADESDADKQIYGRIDWQQAFDSKPVGQKMWIVFAGPLANLLLAFVLYWGLLLQGEAGLRPLLGPVTAGSPAALADLREGDTIVTLNGQPVATWEDVHWLLLERSMSEQPLSLTTRTPQGELHKHMLNLSSVSVDTSDLLQQIGLAPAMPRIPAVVGSVLPGSVAEKSGLQIGDQIVSINQKPVSDWQQVVKTVRANPEHVLKLTYKRGDALMPLKLIPELVSEHGQKIGRLGAGVDMQAVDLNAYRIIRHYTASKAALRAVEKLSQTVELTLKMITRMLTGQASLKAISGPVSIADAAGQSAALGWQPYIGFIALLSISIAVMNLLPIPVLDGGHLMYHMAEMIRGEPLPQKMLDFGQRVGLGMLGTLMLVAFFNDISRYLAG